MLLFNSLLRIKAFFMKNHSQHKFEIFLKGKLEEIDHLSLSVEQFSKKMGINDFVKNQLNLILEELYTNTANYGFQGIKDGQVSISLILLDGQIEITYQDNGIAFNPLEMDDPDLLLNLDERAVGGLGVFFVKAMTDQVSYARDGDLNVLTMHKTLLNK
jgi:serine/threonine-protein kinase RsbW